MKPVDVLTVMEEVTVGLDVDASPHAQRFAEVRAAVAELIRDADTLQKSLLPTLVKQSTKNPNAGFIDWRDWCALYGEVSALRIALARCQPLPDHLPSDMGTPTIGEGK